MDKTEAKQIRVLIVDDHAVVRQGLRTFLDLQEDITVVAEGENGLEAIRLAEALLPDVVLLDLVMPHLDGIEATRRILECSPGSQVLILTSFGDDDQVFPAIRAGAQGYLLKDIQPDELVNAVRQAYQGKTQLHPDIARKLLSAVAAGAPAGEAKLTADTGLHEASTPLPEDLTPRELEVLQLIAAGMSNRAIAEKMVISEKTVKTHVSSVLGKLGVADRTQAAIWALQHGLAGEA
jgi:NarL family two-component system response regulator LiaR